MKQSLLALALLAFVFNPWLAPRAWPGDATLDDKLAAQWALFAAARTAVLDQARQPLADLTRERWESLLAPRAGEALTPDELAQLRERQRRRIAQSRRHARLSSVIDLARVRRTGRVAEFCAEFPKGGMLHVHTWGSLDRATVHLLMQEVNPKVDPWALRGQLLDPRAARGFYAGELDFLNGADAGLAYAAFAAPDRARLENLFFLPPGTHPFARFDGVFLFMSMMLDSRPEVDALNIVYTALFERARREGVTYLELTEDSPSTRTEFDRFSRRAELARRDFGLTVRFLAAFNRGAPSEQNRARALRLLAWPASEALVGINLLSDETHAPAFETGQSVYATVGAAVRGGNSALRATMHAGELGDARNPRDALLLGAERLGHAVKLRDDPVTLEYASRQKIPVEANLVSNWRLQAVDSIEHHPFLDFLRLGLRVSLSTDDEGLLETDINNECRQTIQRTDVTYAELKQMAENSLTTSFAQPLVRDELLAEWRASVERFERRWAGLHG